MSQLILFILTTILPLLCLVFYKRLRRREARAMLKDSMSVPRTSAVTFMIAFAQAFASLVGVAVLVVLFLGIWLTLFPMNIT